MHQMKHTTLFEPQLSWPDMDLRTAYGLWQHVCDQCLRQTFRTAYETQGKSYDLMEFMQAQY